MSFFALATVSRCRLRADGEAALQRIESGRLKGRRLKALPRDVPGLRPTGARVRGAIFDRLGSSVDGVRVLDLFGGSGALAIEALSRGARHATIVDQSPKVVRHLEAQVRDLDLDGAVQLRCADALGMVQERSPQEPYDLVFIDPPFATPGIIAPLAEGLVRGWLGAGAIVVCERERIRGKSLEVKWPEALLLETTRIYGQAEVAFLRYDP